MPSTHRELTRQESVEDDAKGDNADDEKRPMPRFRHVRGIVQDDQALNDGSNDECEGCKTYLPSHDRGPTFENLSTQA